MSTTWDAPQFTPSPYGYLYPRSLVLHRAARASQPLTRGLTVSLSPFKGLGVSRGNQPSPAPNFPFPALGCALLLAGAWLRHRRAIPPWEATFWGLYVVVMPTPVFATFPRTSLSPS